MGRIGEVLQTARVAKGMTQADLASAAGVAQGALSRYEHDLRTPDESTVETLAAALGIHPSLLERAERISGGIAVGAHMRRKATAPATQWRRLEAELNVARWHAERLRDDVLIRADLSLPAFDPFDDEPADAARMLRAQWRIPLGPIASVVEWLEAAGVLVIGKDLGRTSRVDG
ncbi:MAG: helix-turn-helix domain-containing protein, partial [Bifidobacteriaceae bacterium]|nr:helix-turn-helix domain-containing protein [Bifidobacteriaceae bacterium]